MASGRASRSWAIAVPPARGPRPLILDRELSRRLRQLAAAVGRESGHDVDGSIAAWVWSDGNWSPHRYRVYLSFVQAAADQLAGDDSWPSGAAPDLLECALFTTGWETSG
ncbi:8-oxoguanine DNA glycosylase OGG fold protein [Streptomyces sp. NPDC004976]